MVRRVIAWAGAYRGSSKGMRGGLISVGNHAGDEVGSHLRRGTIAIRGNAGQYCGVGMIAGTILIGGNVGGRPGIDNKRGTIVVGGRAAELPASYSVAAVYAPTFLRLYQKWLPDEWAQMLGGNFRRYIGDSLALGKGEILLLEPVTKTGYDSHSTI